VHHAGFFIDVELFYSKDNFATPISDGLKQLTLNEPQLQATNFNDTENLMIKLKFLPYKVVQKHI
jgi:hypothetical protein